MIIGLDVAHNVGSDKESIIGFTASLDKYISKYYSDIAIKSAGKNVRFQDITFELEPLFQKAILRFKELNSGKEP